MEYIIEPFVSVGKIRFDMIRDDIIEIFGNKPDRENTCWHRVKEIFYSNIHIIFNQNGFVNEVIFYEGKNKLIFEGNNLFNDNNVIKLLSIKEEPINASGKILFNNFGILFFHFEDKEEKRISVFSKRKNRRYSRMMINELFAGKPFMLLEYYYDKIKSDIKNYHKYFKNILDLATIIYKNGNDYDKEKLYEMINKIDLICKEQIKSKE